MGFIELSAGLADTDKMAIAVSFMIPQDAIDAAIAQYEAIPVEAGSLTDINLPGIIPLITFGQQSAVTGGPMDSTSRCFIGVACGHISNADMVDEEPLPPPRLMVYLQYDTGDMGAAVECSDFFQVGGQPGVFLSRGSLLEGSFITVTADEWHTLIVSFDMSAGCQISWTGSGASNISFDGGCSFWWSLDDVNYNGAYLWPGNPNNYDENSGPANEIYSTGSLSVTSETSPRTFAAGDLPLTGNPVGIPGCTADLPKNYNIRMSAIKVFTDVSLDTSVENNRRVFVRDGGGPAALSLATAHFGKDPEIYFPTHTDWISGNNHGTAGDFTPTGTIIQYTPGP